MKIKCENIVICGNYNCAWNYDCRCSHDVVSLDANGKCALEKPKATVKSKDDTQSAQNKF